MGDYTTEQVMDSKFTKAVNETLAKYGLAVMRSDGTIVSPEDFYNFEQTQLDRIEAKIDQLLAKKKPKPRASKKVEYHPAFENVYVDYPKVAGANKVECYAQYNQRLSENKGSVNDFICDLHASVIQYGDFCKETGRWLMSPQAFMGHKKHYENDWTIPTAPDNVPRDNDKLEAFALEHGYRLAWSGETFADWRKALEKLHRRVIK